MGHGLVVAKGLGEQSEMMSRAVRASQDGQVLEKGSDNAWSTGGGKANHSSILAARTS